MTGRIISSCVFYALVAAGLGFCVTLGLHRLIDPSGLTQVRWNPGEPQWLGVMTIYGLIGAALRYLHINVFGPGLRYFNRLPATATNTNYQPAVMAGAVMFVAPLLIYKLLIIDIQLEAEDHAHPSPYFSLKGLMSEGVLNDLVPPKWFGSWPLNFYVALLAVAVLGGLVGFFLRADHRNEYRPFVVTAYGVGGLFAGKIAAVMAAAGLPLLPGALGQFFDKPPGWVVACVGIGLPLGFAARFIYYRANPQEHAKRRARVFKPKRSFSERVALLNFILQASGAIVSSAFIVTVMAVAYIGGIWSFVIIAHQGKPIETLWLWIAWLTTVFALYVIARNLSELYLGLAPLRSKPLDPTDEPYGPTPSGPSDRDIDNAFGTRGKRA